MEEKSRRAEGLWTRWYLMGHRGGRSHGCGKRFPSLAGQGREQWDHARHAGSRFIA